jgi:hypothetical protein
MSGIDWAQIDGIDVLTAKTVIAEVGADLSAFPSEKQFTAGLCPTNEQSGGKILNRRTRKVVWLFAMRLAILLRSQNYMGAQYRRLRPDRELPRLSPPWLESRPCLFYRLIKDGHPYLGKESNTLKPDNREQQIRSLTKRAQRLGLQLVISKTA